MTSPGPAPRTGIPCGTASSRPASSVLLAEAAATSADDCRILRPLAPRSASRAPVRRGTPATPSSCVRRRRAPCCRRRRPRRSPAADLGSRSETTFRPSPLASLCSVASGSGFGPPPTGSGPLPTGSGPPAHSHPGMSTGKIFMSAFLQAIMLVRGGDLLHYHVSRGAGIAWKSTSRGSAPVMILPPGGLSRCASAPSSVGIAS